MPKLKFSKLPPTNIAIVGNALGYEWPSFVPLSILSYLNSRGGLLIKALHAGIIKQTLQIEESTEGEKL